MAKSLVSCNISSFLLTHGRQRRPDSVVAPAEEVQPPSPVVVPLTATTPALDVYGKIPLCRAIYRPFCSHTAGSGVQTLWSPMVPQPPIPPWWWRPHSVRRMAVIITPPRTQ